MFRQSYRSKPVPASGILSPGVSVVWRDGDISDNGMIITLLDGTNRLLRQSLDGGLTWGILSNLAVRTYTCFGASPDGSALAVGVSTGVVYSSADTGVTWNTGGLPSKDWGGIGIANDNLSGFATISSGTVVNPIYRTLNLFAGANTGTPSKKDWTGVECATVDIAYASYSSGTGINDLYKKQAGSLNWVLYFSGHAVFNISSDGTKVVHTSSDGGASIHVNGDAKNSGTLHWGSVDICNDGTKIVGCVGLGFSGYVYLSVNSGATFVALTQLGIGDWRFVKMAANGSRLVAARSNGQAYIVPL